MRFHPGPEPLPERAAEPPAWRWLLIASALVAIGCSVTPWVCVQFSRLWGAHSGPPGWQSSAGFTCFFSCALLVMLTLVETEAVTTQHAVRPGSLLLAALTTLVVTFEWWDGPGQLRGVSAMWTAWFYAVLVCMPFLLFACSRRWLFISNRRA